MQASTPGIFGARGASGKVTALIAMSFQVGALLGPLVCGGLVEGLNYYYMNCVMGKLSLLSYSELNQGLT